MGIDYPNGGMDGLPAILEAAVAGGPEGSGPDSNPVVYAANDYETLGGYLGYEGEALDNFVASIERYNELAEKGIDEDMGKPAQFLKAIKQPPFYGIHRHIGLSTIIHGVNVNKDMQALNADGEPIEGLYASGNTCGMRFGPEYITPIPGVSIGMCLTLGRELGKYLAAK